MGPYAIPMSHRSALQRDYTVAVRGLTPTWRCLALPSASPHHALALRRLGLRRPLAPRLPCLGRNPCPRTYTPPLPCADCSTLSSADDEMIFYSISALEVSSVPEKVEGDRWWTSTSCPPPPTTEHAAFSISSQMRPE